MLNDCRCLITHVKTVSFRFCHVFNKLLTHYVHFFQQTYHWSAEIGHFSFDVVTKTNVTNNTICHQLKQLEHRIQTTSVWSIWHKRQQRSDLFSFFCDNSSIMLTASGCEHSPLSCFANKPLPCLGLVTDGSLSKAAEDSSLTKDVIFNTTVTGLEMLLMMVTVHFDVLTDPGFIFRNV